MDLREALSILSKSSPYAVTTVSELAGTEFDELKKCLYVKTEIEEAFEAKLAKIKSGEILFLCGSSGDGKSEILTKYKKKNEQYIDFHLDATHSFKPDMSAIDTLDKVFADHAAGSRPLVVGINIGMLGNYEREGSDTHASIKQAINAFLNNETIDSHFTFLDFESYPKFTIKDGRVSSPFFSNLLDNVVKDDRSNKFREYFNKDYGNPKEAVLCSNYLMLRDRRIQNVVIELLLNARIRKDQFVTARMLLDFIHSILTGPNYLFDNLFNGGDNELLKVLIDFDPSVIRNHKLDLFILHRTLELQDEDYRAFQTAVTKKFGLPNNLDPQSTVRMLYILKECDLGSNYHRNFKGSFNERPLQKYKQVWEAHRNYDGNSNDKKWLREFYSKIVLKAINKYANRNAAYLSKDEFYLSSHGGCDLAAEVELSIDYKSIEANNSEDLAAFNMYLEVDGEKLEAIPIGVNLLVLMMDIVEGYRPNKYDKNSVVLLDELITKITQKASAADTLFLHKDGERIKLRASSDNEIRVSGL
ncbi:DNA phosphorothioation-dependent restriction protein DptF [Amphritea sp. 1_MG-2023]|uniref:DNA phosphorothioation-dependent restriction protein DptF n=1 Tax=Amphritea sp. 1_MG-2023 TaxID=3062670 RepID=UPI0026E1BB3C|nr:DNA phosphorothioation-dependent restriction protein DptF [Amphritea sp. 1_MG-2023]MDO6562645.1 DNA phosphorothioation-dependent restriction protein DptF [Amphritea sp. 1_MG-2023]